MRDNMTPIRTTFNGVEYRSRLEANVAQMLYQLGIVYEYEPSSFLLDDGTHYRPDFWCPEIRLWVEVRGYSNQKGDRQIRQFGDAVMAGRLRADKMLLKQAPTPLWSCGTPKEEATCPPECQHDDWHGWRSRDDVDYMVLSPGGECRFFEVPNCWTDQGRDTAIIVCLCKCGKVYFASRSNDWQCRVCGASDKQNHLEASDAILLDGFGRPVVDHIWFDRHLERYGHSLLPVPAWLDIVRRTP